MQWRSCALLIILGPSISAIGQVAPTATGEDAPFVSESQMMTPPPVNGATYPNVAGEDVRTNYMAAEFRTDVAYTDNVLPTLTAKPVSDYNYSVYPTVSFNRTTPRDQATFIYSPAITFYKQTSALDTVNQAANLNIQNHLSRHLAISVRDLFIRTSDVFNQPYPLTAGGISGLPGAVPGVIVPFTMQLSNVANAAMTWQFARDAMIGVGGSHFLFKLHNRGQGTGLDNSGGEGVQAFYSRRLTSMRYSGVAYDFERTTFSPTSGPVEIDTQTFLPFYSYYFNPQSSVSISAGAAHIDATQAQHSAFTGWRPTAVVSFGWQGLRSNVAASYQYTIIEGDGLAGAFTSNGVTAAGSVKLNRMWTAVVSMSYADLEAAAQLAALTGRGRTFAAQVSLEQQISTRLTARIGYDRLHESFNGISAIAPNPNIDSAFVSVAYAFRKPMGR